MNKRFNHLAEEKSPYLRQHAENPVDWYPWGEEAFQKAREEDKPVFLSIGYSTCHWCHVMERESFEDDDVAALLNSGFVCIKVDKEERPDIDAIYMKVCQGMTGSGGWPLTIVMDWRQRPFFAGTYFPKEGRFQIPGLMEILADLSGEWREERRRIEETQERVLQWLNRQESGGGKTPLHWETAQPAEEERLRRQRKNWEMIFRAVRELAAVFDRENGGFGKRPKFPCPQNLMFLLRFYDLQQKTAAGTAGGTAAETEAPVGEPAFSVADPELAARAREMAERTLRQMYRGGLFDHIGGGFSRYSTDERWLAPHFEKMLYDNCLLAISYMEAYKLFDEPCYRSVAERTLAYLMRDMRGPDGGFYAAQDADSEGEEGKYYTFTTAEVRAVLGERVGEAFCRRYDITERGNFEGKNIPNLLDGGGRKGEELPAAEDESEAEAAELEAAREELYAYRKSRYRLHRDDKCLTAWNAMAAAAFAKAARLLPAGGGEGVGTKPAESYLQTARETMSFLRRTLRREDGSLHISECGGKVSGAGTLDEYAYDGWALLELYETTLEEEYLREAYSLVPLLKKRFWDNKSGGFFLTDKEGERLIYRPKELYDGALPSGNSVAAYFLAKLYKQTKETSIGALAEAQAEYLRQTASEAPEGHCFSLMALLLMSTEKSFLCENGVCN